MKPFVLVLIGLLVVSGCSTAEPLPTNIPLPTNTPLPTDTPEPTPTDPPDPLVNITYIFYNGVGPFTEDDGALKSQTRVL